MDAQIAIYGTDQHPVYGPACEPLWRAVQEGAATVISSELTLMETLVGPLRNGDRELAARREGLWSQANVRLVPIAREILRQDARLRAARPALRTPDALHVATALDHGGVQFLTDDRRLRRAPGLIVTILDDLIGTS